MHEETPLAKYQHIVLLKIIIKIVVASIYQPKKRVTNHSTSNQIQQISNIAYLLENLRHVDYDLLLRL